MKKFVSVATGLGAFAPMLALAGTLGGAGTTIENAVGTLGAIVNALIPIAFAAALLFFFWGLARYILGDASEKEKGRNLMIWGVVALFVMASIWGIVQLLATTLGVGTVTDQNVPGIVP